MPAKAPPISWWMVHSASSRSWRVWTRHWCRPTAWTRGCAPSTTGPVAAGVMIYNSPNCSRLTLPVEGKQRRTPPLPSTSSSTRTVTSTAASPSAKTNSATSTLNSRLAWSTQAKSPTTASPTCRSTTRTTTKTTRTTQSTWRQPTRCCRCRSQVASLCLRSRGSRGMREWRSRISTSAA